MYVCTYVNTIKQWDLFKGYWYVLGLCDNKTYILIMHSKIISIMIAILINNNKSAVHVSGFLLF